MTTDTRPDIPLGYTHDDNDKVLTCKNSDGSWQEYTRDTRGNELTYKDNTDYWYEFTYDANGNVLTGKDSNGYWYEYACDDNGNVLTYKDSADYSYEYTRDTHGNVLTYKDSDGASWVAIAHSDPYTLGYDARTHLYHAHCRKFTRAKALAHWGTPRADNTERAALFHAAITNHKESE
jgi:YD repeat-containing protein